MRLVSTKRMPAPHWHKVFLAMLPQILRIAGSACSQFGGEAREDFVQEVVANSLVAFVALVRRGKMDLAFPSVLSRYAVAQIREGRRVGNRLNVREVLSSYAQRQKGFRVESLDQFDEAEQAWTEAEQAWTEAVVEDKTAGPDDIARTRIDFSEWLSSLKRRDRRLAVFLARGESTQAAAKNFKVSNGRVSQLRRELAENWRQFVGDEPITVLPAAA